MDKLIKQALRRHEKSSVAVSNSIDTSKSPNKRKLLAKQRDSRIMRSKKDIGGISDTSSNHSRSSKIMKFSPNKSRLSSLENSPVRRTVERRASLISSTERSPMLRKSLDK